MNKEITLIYPFRNRDSVRVKNSLESLKLQTDKGFKVIFIDYGSKENIANEVKTVVESYSFASYYYTYHVHQPWNKSKAINIALDMVLTDYCFVSDVDMIYGPNFISIAKKQAICADVIYFQVGYLPHNIVVDLSSYESIIPYRISNENATGLTLFKTQQLKKINGFDEYFHFWSSEDTDAHERMKNAGFSLKFYDEKLLIKHQPHPTYRSRETKNLTVELRLSDAVRFNQKRMLVNKESGVSFVKQNRSKIIDREMYLDLNKPDLEFNLSNIKSEVYYYFLEELKRCHGKKVMFKICQDDYYKSFKYNIKELMGSNSQPYLSMKQVNDLLLQQVIFKLREYNYNMIVHQDLKRIDFIIDLRK